MVDHTVTNRVAQLLVCDALGSGFGTRDRAEHFCLGGQQNLCIRRACTSRAAQEFHKVSATHICIAINHILQQQSFVFSRVLVLIVDAEVIKLLQSNVKAQN